MLAQPDPLPFVTDFDPQTGTMVEIRPGLTRLTAPNASPYTFTGTNTFLVGASRPALIDPGPDKDAHAEAIRKALGGRTPAAIILTHTHKDHSALAPRLAAETGAPIWAAGPHRLSRPRRLLEINPISASCDWKLTPDRKLADGEELIFDDMSLVTITTPGHCANHLAFALPAENCILTGDHVMGWNSTLVATPDGSMADYLASLDRLIARKENIYLPAHGGMIANGRSFARALKAHRLHRNGQILSCITQGIVTLGAMKKAIYPHLPDANSFAARLTLRAHLEYLLEQHTVTRSPGIGGWRYSLS